MKKYRIHLIALVIALSVGGLSSLKLGQDINWDLLNYHYYNPYAFLEGKVEHNIGVGGIVTYENPLRDVPSYLLIDNLSPKKAGVIIGAFQGLNIFLLFEIAWLLFRKLKAKKLVRFGVALGVAVLSFFGAGGISEIGSTMGDNISSIFVLAGLLLLIYSLNKPLPRKLSPRWIRLAAFFTVGFGMGLKLTTVVYGAALLVAGLLIEGNIKQKLKESALHFGALFVGIMTSAGFWYWRMWQLFDSPIFPFYNAIFNSPYYPHENFEDIRWTATSVWQGLSEPFQYFKMQAISVEIPFRDPRIAVACAAVLVLLGYLAARKWWLKKLPPLAHWSRQHTVLIVFFAVSYVAWALQFSYFRYAMVLEFTSLITIAVVVYALIRRFWTATITLGVILGIITAMTWPISWGRVAWQGNYFGVTEGDFTYLEDSTVLMGGFAALSFLVPYFPESAQTIRVESGLSSPNGGTPEMRKIIVDAVEKKKAKGSKFYGLRTDEDAVSAEAAFNSHGFKSVSCEEIHTHSRAGFPQKYRMCKLEAL